MFYFCIRTGKPVWNVVFWTSIGMLELIELSGQTDFVYFKCPLVVTLDPYWASRKYSLELMELFSVNKV